MRYLLIIILSVFSVSLQAQTKQQAETVDLKVVITNINTQKGSIELGVFDNSKGFLSKGHEYRTHSQKVNGNTMTIIIKDLPKGTYAVSFFQDINSDGKCNINILARPTEPYGFSNNVKLKLFKPSFESCQLNVQQDKTITIKAID